MRNLRTTASVARRYSRGLRELATNRNGRRIPMLRRRAFDLARTVTPVVSVTSGGISYFVSTSDRAIGRELFALRQFDERVMERAMHLVSRHTAAGDEALPGGPSRLPLAGTIFVDVGANIGTATIPALLRFGAARALAFEPDERSFRLLRHNLLENDLTERVVAERAAVWDEPGVAVFETVDSNWGDGRVRTTPGPVPGSFQEDQRTTTEVPLVTLDAFVAEHGVEPGRIGLLWVDAQGAEFHVLNGARSILSSGVPVVMEYWPYGLRRAGGLRELSGLVAEHYTSIVDLRLEPASGGCRPIPPDQLDSLQVRYEADTAFTDLLLLP